MDQQRYGPRQPGTVPWHGPPSTSPMRLVIIDDHQMVLDGLKAMLRPYAAQVEIVGECSESADAVRTVEKQAPDAVLLDVRLRGASGLDLCGQILAVQPGCKVVFLTVYDDEQYLYQALRVGAAGFLLKRIRGGELVDYLGRIRDGEVLIDPPWPAGSRCPLRGCTAGSSGPARTSGSPSGRARCSRCSSPGCPTGRSRPSWWSARRP